MKQTPFMDFSTKEVLEKSEISTLEQLLYVLANAIRIFSKLHFRANLTHPLLTTIT